MIAKGLPCRQGNVVWDQEECNWIEECPLCLEKLDLSVLLKDCRDTKMGLGENTYCVCQHCGVWLDYNVTNDGHPEWIIAVPNSNSSEEVDEVEDRL